MIKSGIQLDIWVIMKYQRHLHIAYLTIFNIIFFHKNLLLNSFELNYLFAV